MKKNLPTRGFRYYDEKVTKIFEFIRKTKHV